MAALNFCCNRIGINSWWPNEFEWSCVVTFIITQLRYKYKIFLSLKGKGSFFIMGRCCTTAVAEQWSCHPENIRRVCLLGQLKCPSSPITRGPWEACKQDLGIMALLALFVTPHIWHLEPSSLCLLTMDSLLNEFAYSSFKAGGRHHLLWNWIPV